MNYVWTIKMGELFNLDRATFLYRTNNRKLKFSEEVFVNNNGYAQIKKTNNFVGFVLKAGKNLTILEHLKLVHKLEQRVLKELSEGKEYKHHGQKRICYCT